MAISMRGSSVFLVLLSSWALLAQNVRATSSETKNAPDAGPMGTSMDAATDSAATEAQPDAENEIDSEESDESRDKRNLGYGGGYGAAPASTVTISVIPGASSYPAAAAAVPGKVTVVPGPETYGGNGYINGYQPYGGPSPPRYKRNYPYKPPFWYFH